MKGGTVMRRTAWAGLTLLTAPAAFGQAQGMGQWLSEVSTQDGDSIVEPGETATVSLWMDMDPSVGEMLPDGTSVYAFALGFFDMLGGANADMGMVLEWEGNDTLTHLVGDTGTTDGVSIFDVELGQLLNLDTDQHDPIFLMSFKWEPADFGEFEVTYVPFVDIPEEGSGFWIHKDDFTHELWATDGHEIVIMIVPAPSICIPFLASFVLSRRRRAQS
jgi:hypothetical protein